MLQLKQLKWRCDAGHFCQNQSRGLVSDDHFPIQFITFVKLNQLKLSLQMLSKMLKLPAWSALARKSNYGFSQHISQLANNAQQFLKRTRNIAIIAHVDHGKTTLVDSLLRYGGVNIHQECALDSNQLEREKGITILSKCTNILYDSYNINIVDTPGHHDFGGEVERVLGMVDGVCLVICATEGPMTQSKFVLRKALQQKLKPIVIVNKVDRPTARPKEVVNEVFDLFCDLNCPDSLLDYPLFYASGKNQWAVKDLNDEKKSIQCILKGIVDNVPQPKVRNEKKFSMLVTQTHPNAYFGKMMLGKINSGQLTIGQQLSTYDQEGKFIETGKVTKITKITGLSHIELDKAFAGDIVSVAGFPTCRVTYTAIEDGFPEKVIPSIKIDPPLMGVSINVNTSPFAGKEGEKLTLNDLKNRLLLEAENDVALEVNTGSKNSTSIMVKGRGDLHIGILLEKMRREGYEFSVTPPQIMYKIDPKTKQKLEPIQKISFEIEENFQNLIMEKMNHRKGIYIESTNVAGNKIKMEFFCSTRGLIGIRSQLLSETQGTTVIRSQFHEYKPYLGPIRKNPKGAIISMCEGVTTPYALKEIEKFGPLFVKANSKVYNGLVIGENTKETDVEVNPTKEKKLTNVRTHAHDQKIMLIPPRIMGIQDAICYIRDDELLEVTPVQIRIRKKELDQNGRERVRKEKKNELKNFKESTA